MRQPPTQLSTVLKALADSTRLRVLTTLLERGETCVCELSEECDCSAPTLSFHLGKLSAAGLVTSRKVGKWVFYRPDADGIARVRESLAGLLDASRTPERPLPGSASCLCADGCLPAGVEGLRELRRERTENASQA
ncbi:MAG: metalloregulator ArsR/SmtB family transcription factor [Armatimonadota bacterium]